MVFSIERVGDHRINIILSGKVTHDVMRALLDELFLQSEGIEHGVFYYDIQHFEMPTLGSFLIEFKKLPRLLRLLKQFDRAAVVTEHKWLGVASEIEGALIPGFSIRAFERHQVAAAEAWLAAGRNN